MASVFNEKSFLKKLDHLTPTQDSVQSLALWIIHHKINHDIICRLWLRKLNDEEITGKQRLALFYLANDVIQTCKRKNARIFQETFKKYLLEAITLVRNDSLKKNIERVIDVWSERNVYDKEFVAKLKEALFKEPTANPHSTKSPSQNSPPTVKSASPINEATKVQTENEDANDLEKQKIIAEFQPKKLCDSINTFYDKQKATNLSKANVEATRLLDINVDHVKQYRDKNQCANFKTEFENSCLKLEDFLTKLSDEAAQRKQLIQLLEQSEIFYDAQFKDATTVANAYRIYGTKVHAVKRKLDDNDETKKKTNITVTDSKLDSMDMEMSDDDSPDSKSNSKSNLLADSASSLATAIDNHAKKYHRHSSQSAATSSTASSSNNHNNRVNLDPRQNRHASKKKGHGHSADKASPIKERNSRNIPSDEDLKLNDGNSPSTPVRDEHSPSHLMDQQSSKSHNPLDFLTKFINKSSSNIQSIQIPSMGINSTQNLGEADNKKENLAEKPSANLSYLVNSLKKFVNTSTASGSGTTPMVTSPDMANKYFDPSSSFQNSFITEQASSSQQRAGTPTKDEIYQPPQPPLPPTSPQFIHQNQQPPPPAAPMQFHPMYQIQHPPPHPMGMMNMQPHMQPPLPSSATSQLMVDPNFHPNFMYNQPPPQLSPLTPTAAVANVQYQYPNQQNKMMISPGSNSSISPNPNMKSGQVNSPNNSNSGYWITPNNEAAHNEYVPDQNSQVNLTDLGNNNNNNQSANTNFPENSESLLTTETPNDIKNNFNLGSNSNNNNHGGYDHNDGFQKRNNHNNYDDSRGNYRGGYKKIFNNHNSSYHNNNNFNNNGHNNGYNNQRGNFNNSNKPFNRIPTINSQRNDRGDGNQQNNFHGKAYSGRGGGTGYMGKYNNNNNNRY